MKLKMRILKAGTPVHNRERAEGEIVEVFGYQAAALEEAGLATRDLEGAPAPPAEEPEQEPERAARDLEGAPAEPRRAGGRGRRRG